MTKGSPFWTCACGAMNVLDHAACEVCGADHRRLEPPREATSDSSLSMYREVPDRPERPPYDPTERCTKPGCNKTAADHIAEAKALIPRVFARLTGGARLPTSEMDRPAAAWGPTERMQRATQELARYREHLKAQEAS